MTLFAGNLPYNITVENLEDLFEPYDLVAVNLKAGFAFLEFQSEEKASQAMKVMNGFQINGRSLCLEYSKVSNTGLPLACNPTTGSDPAVNH